MKEFDKYIIYLVGDDILNKYWLSGHTQDENLRFILSCLYPYQWDNCLSGDPAYEDEYFKYLQRNYKGKEFFSYDEAIEIIKGFFLSYKPIAKIKTYVLQQLHDKEKMMKRFEEMKKEDIYKIHSNQN